MAFNIWPLNSPGWEKPSACLEHTGMFLSSSRKCLNVNQIKLFYTRIKILTLESMLVELFIELYIPEKQTSVVKWVLCKLYMAEYIFTVSHPWCRVFCRTLQLKTGNRSKRKRFATNIDRFFVAHVASLFLLCVGFHCCFVPHVSVTIIWGK